MTRLVASLSTIVCVTLALVFVVKCQLTERKRLVPLLHVSAAGDPAMVGLPTVVDWIAQWLNRQPSGNRVLPVGYDFSITHATNEVIDEKDLSRLFC